MYLRTAIKNASKVRQQLNGKKSHVTKQYNDGKITEAAKQEFNKAIDDARVILTDYMKRNEKRIADIQSKNKKIQLKEGTGIKGRGMIKKAEKERNRIKGYKANITKKYNIGSISKAEMQIMNKKLDNKMAELNKYIKEHKKKIKVRKQRGGNVVFFNDPKQLLKKLELIVGEVLAGNTSIQMRNMGVNILDTLLKISTINKEQYNKLYNQYFKV